MYTLEAGAIVLADQGLCCIDELDKVSDNDRSALHEVMKQQTCSVAKGGIVATLNARTSILAAANPNDGKYDMDRSIKENVEPIPIPLLTRFDLIHIVRDLKEPDTDELIAAHILNIGNKDQSGEIDVDLLRKYLAYAKKLQPTITDEAKQAMKEFYMKMRTVNAELMTVTPRQLEGILRLAMAHAKILLKDVVDKEDAELAINLVMKSMESIGTDLTGEVKHMGKLSEKELFFSMFTEPRTEEWLIEELTKDPRFSEVKVRNYIMSSNRKGELLYNNGVYYK